MSQSKQYNEDFSQHHRDPIELLAEEFLQRLRHGRSPTIEEYESVYPEHASEIRELFPTLLLMEHAALDQSLPHGRQVSIDNSYPALERLGDYRILREIGRGGMGIVYLAEQESLARQVALKVLPAPALLQRGLLRRFESESRAAASLHHTNIVPVFGVGQQDGWHYYVMQYIDGVSIDQLVRDLSTNRQLRLHSKQPARDNDAEANGDAKNIVDAHAYASGRRDDSARSADVRKSLSDDGVSYWKGIATIGIQIAEALAYANQQRVLHRDVKPSNLLLDKQGRAWLTDFGLAKIIEADDITCSNDVVGTLRYLAPERMHGRNDHRSDIYGLGLTLYEIATLRPAFSATDKAILIKQILHHEPKRPRFVDTSIPRDLETIIQKAISKEPETRYQRAEDLADDLNRFVGDRPIHARRSAWYERLYRWSRRNRATAAVSLALLISTLCGVTGVVAKWREAVIAREHESHARENANALAVRLEKGLVNLRESYKLLDLGKTAIDGRHWDDGIEALSMAIEKSPDDPRMWLERADIFAQLGLNKLSLSDFQHAFACQEPETSNSWYRLGLLQCESGLHSEYEELCQKMQKRFGGTVQRYFVSELIRTCVLAPQKGLDYNLLADTAEELVEADPTSWYYQYLSGLACLRAGRYLVAKTRLSEALAENPYHTVYRLNCPVLAIVEFRLGNLTAAQKLLRDGQVLQEELIAARCAPHNSNDWVIHWGQTGTRPIPWWDNLELEITMREASLLIDGKLPTVDPRAALIRARTLAALRWLDQANQAFQEAIIQSPDNQTQMERHRFRGNYFAMKHNWHEAVSEFHDALQFSLDDLVLWRFFAYANLKNGDITAYRKCCVDITERFKDITSSFEAAIVLELCTTVENAIPDLNSLERFEQIADNGWHNGPLFRGATLYRMKKYSEAVEQLEEARRVYRPEAWDSCILAMCYYRLGDQEQASQHLKDAEAWIATAERTLPNDYAAQRPNFGSWCNELVVRRFFNEAKSLIIDSAILPNSVPLSIKNAGIEP